MKKIFTYTLNFPKMKPKHFCWLTLSLSILDGPVEQITLSCDKLMMAPYIPPYDMGLLEGNLMSLLSQTRQEKAAQAQSSNE